MQSNLFSENMRDKDALSRMSASKSWYDGIPLLGLNVLAFDFRRVEIVEVVDNGNLPLAFAEQAINQM